MALECSLLNSHVKFVLKSREIPQRRQKSLSLWTQKYERGKKRIWWLASIRMGNREYGRLKGKVQVKKFLYNANPKGIFPCRGMATRSNGGEGQWCGWFWGGRRIWRSGVKSFRWLEVGYVFEICPDNYREFRTLQPRSHSSRASFMVRSSRSPMS